MRLSDCLKIKQKIEVRKHGDRDFYVSGVQEINENSISIDIPYLARRPLILQPGTAVTVQFVAGEGLYEFESRVLEYHPGVIPFYNITVSDNIKVGQRRSLFRLSITLDAECWIQVPPSPSDKGGKPAHKIIKAKTIDISGSGVRICSFEPLKKDENFTLVIKFEEMEPQKFPARVIWTNRVMRNEEPIYYSGVRFVDIPRKVQDNLVRYLFKVQARRRLVEKVGE